ncbi:transposase [Microcoleus sp. MON1_C1]|uniref:transposase n=1 Tax=Microcoleus sp. MON1_C1 TaxID=2818827 RepID=UPI004040A576
MRQEYYACLTRTHARSQRGTRAYAVKPFYRGKKVTVIGAISFQRVVALMTIDNSMDSQAFDVFIAQCLVPQLWSGAVVVMDNLPAHKVDSIRERVTFAMSIYTKVFLRLPIKSFK